MRIKSILAALLAVVISAGAFCVPAFAYTGEDSEPTVQDAVPVCFFPADGFPRRLAVFIDNVKILHVSYRLAALSSKIARIDMLQMLPGDFCQMQNHGPVCRFSVQDPVPREEARDMKRNLLPARQRTDPLHHGLHLLFRIVHPWYDQTGQFCMALF